MFQAARSRFIRRMLPAAFDSARAGYKCRVLFQMMRIMPPHQHRCYNTRPTFPHTKRPIVIIGAGGIVRDAHLPAYQKAGFEVQGIFDLETKKAEALAQTFPFIQQVCGSLTELVDLATTTTQQTESSSSDNSNSVFDLAVPPSEIIATLNQLPRKSVVLIQKPMGENLAQAKEILQVCRDKQLVAGINFQLRRAPFTILAKHLIDTGVIGTLHDAEVRSCVATPWHMWDFLFHVPRVEILYHSVHYIDLIRYFFHGTSPERVYARTVRDPNMPQVASTRSNIILDYGDFTRATINVHHGHAGFGLKHQESFVKLEGTKGAIKIRLGANLDYPRGLPDIFEYNSLLDDQGWREVKVEGTWFPDAFIGPMAELMCKAENPNFDYVNSVEDAIYTMACVEAAYQSDRDGGVTLKGMVE